MAEKRKLRKKGQGTPLDEEIKPSKIEYDVAKYMKSNVPIKKTRFLSHQVSYFTANKAIDVLLDSPWATGENAIFAGRDSVVDFCNKLLQHKFFHRAKKIAISDKDLSPKELKKKKANESKKKDKDDKISDMDDSKPSTPSQRDEEKNKKKRVKIKLDMHLEQAFVDGSDAYVWMYDPIPFWYYIVGGLLLFSAVAVCLFPLWPPIVRQGVYYISMAAAGFLGVILTLAVARFILFIIIWLLSMGRHHLWILPNLTEDVGFFESFWPLYEYEYRGTDYQKKPKKKKKDSEKSKNLSVNFEDQVDSQSAGETDKLETEGERSQIDRTSNTDTDSDPSNSQKFEVVDKEELSREEEEASGSKED